MSKRYLILADRNLEAQIRQTLGLFGHAATCRPDLDQPADIVIMSSALLSRYKSRENNKLLGLRKGRKLLIVIAEQSITKIVEAVQIADGVVCQEPHLHRLPMIIALMEEGYMSVPAHIASVMIERGLRRKILLSLTWPEQRILSLLGHGCTNIIIAATLEISEGRAKYLIRSLLKKLLLQNRTQAAVFAAREIKLIDAPTSRPQIDNGPRPAVTAGADDLLGKRLVQKAISPEMHGIPGPRAACFSMPAKSMDWPQPEGTTSCELSCTFLLPQAS